MLDPSIVSEANNTRGASTNKRTRRVAAGIEKRLKLEPHVQGYLTPEEAESLVPRGYVITSDLEVITESELRGRRNLTLRDISIPATPPARESTPAPATPPAAAPTPTPAPTPAPEESVDSRARALIEAAREWSLDPPSSSSSARATLPTPKGSLASSLTRPLTRLTSAQPQESEAQRIYRQAQRLVSEAESLHSWVSQPQPEPDQPSPFTGLPKAYHPGSIRLLDQERELARQFPGFTFRSLTTAERLEYCSEYPPEVLPSNPPPDTLYWSALEVRQVSIDLHETVDDGSRQGLIPAEHVEALKEFHVALLPFSPITWINSYVGKSDEGEPHQQEQALGLRRHAATQVAGLATALGRKFVCSHPLQTTGPEDLPNIGPYNSLQLYLGFSDRKLWSRHHVPPHPKSWLNGKITLCKTFGTRVHIDNSHEIANQLNQYGILCYHVQFSRRDRFVPTPKPLHDRGLVHESFNSFTEALNALKLDFLSGFILEKLNALSGYTPFSEPVD